MPDQTVKTTGLAQIEQEQIGHIAIVTKMETCKVRAFCGTLTRLEERPQNFALKRESLLRG